MTDLEKLLSPHQVVVGASLRNADLAIVPVDMHGSAGELNQFVLRHPGYRTHKLPSSEQLAHGFHGAWGKKPVIFVVTINGTSIEANLTKNLRAALSEFQGWLKGKSVWIPLMGTGTGNLSYEQSYSITIRALNDFTTEFGAHHTRFIVALPTNDDATRLFAKITDNSLSKDEEDIPNYFAVGSIWGDNDDQAEMFFKRGIWQNGHDKKFNGLVNSVRPRDILFLKSTFPKGGVSYLRLKGVGIVTSNPKNGTDLTVNWIAENIAVDVSGLGHYRNTITQVTNQTDITALIQAAALSERHAKEFRINNRSTIAGLISDSATGIDFLDLKKDISAFSKIMTSKTFKPPLAIALLGKWGSGKSFFMNQLTNAIDELTKSKKKDLYCEGVAQIHFNAWSYLDANLWASLVSRIFEGLNQYINNDDKAKKLKKEIEQDLSHKLTVTKEEILFLENKKVLLDTKIKSLSAQQVELQERLNDNIKFVKSKTFDSVLKKINETFNTEEKIKSALQSNPTWGVSVKVFEDIVPAKYWRSPSELYERTKSLHTVAREFFRAKKILRNIAFLTGILLLTWYFPVLVELITGCIILFDFTLLQVWISSLAAIGAIWTRYKGAFESLRPVIASFWKIKEDYEKRIREANLAFKQEEKAIKLSIEKDKNELTLIIQQKQQAEIAKTDLEFRINNALATEALYSFIERRSNSEDYKKHLGIVSVIRKDFEILSQLFLEHSAESEGKEFREKFDRPLERIILYIDDLDRCPEERVVEVLEAVNLLMAFPLFIVVVGVDPRWVKNALARKHNSQFKEQNSTEALDVSNYLEKIFQIPFRLKDANNSSIRTMIKRLIPADKTISATNEIANPVEAESAEEIVAQADAPFTQLPDPKINDPIERLILSEQESKMLQDFAPIIGTNPRIVKRFVNIYQVVRAHEDLNYSSRSDGKEFQVIMFLLAVTLGPFKEVSKQLNEFVSDKQNTDRTLSDFMKQNKGDLNIKNLAAELGNEAESSLSDLLAIKIETYRSHTDLIQRFTFENI